MQGEESYRATRRGCKYLTYAKFISKVQICFNNPSVSWRWQLPLHKGAFLSCVLLCYFVASIFCLKTGLRFFHEKIESEFRPNIIGSLEPRAEFRLVSEIIWGNQVGWDFWNDLQVGFQEKNEGCPRGEGTSPLEICYNINLTFYRRWNAVYIINL